MGTELVMKALAGSNPTVYMVLSSDGASDNTKKRIKDRCTYYNTEHHTIPHTPEELSTMLGKTSSVCCIGITDLSFAEGLKRYLTNDDHKEGNE